MVIGYVLAVNNSIIINYAQINYSSGSVGAKKDKVVTISFPITFSTPPMLVSNCNGEAFTCASISTTISQGTLAYQNKNTDNSSSFSRINYIAIGC